MNKSIIPLVAVVVLIGGVSAYAITNRKNTDAGGEAQEAVEMTKTNSTPVSDAAMMAKEKEQEAMAMKKDGGAAYISYKNEADTLNLVKTDGKDVIYFFHATWCPECNAIDKKLTNTEDLAKLGKNIVIVKTDYDTQKELKKKYGITHQTAFVRVDGEGKALKTAVLGDYSDLLTF